MHRYDGTDAGSTARAQRRMAATVGENRAREKNDDDGASVQITRLRSSRMLRCGLHRASATPKMATTAPGSKPKIAGDELASAVTVHRNYIIVIRQNSQITPKFS